MENALLAGLLIWLIQSYSLRLFLTFCFPDRPEPVLSEAECVSSHYVGMEQSPALQITIATRISRLDTADYARLKARRCDRRD